MKEQIYSVLIGRYASKEKGKLLHELPVDPRTIKRIICIKNNNIMIDIEDGNKYAIPESDDMGCVNCIDSYVIKKEVYDVSKLKLLEKLNLARKVVLIRKALEPDYKKYR